MQSKWIQWIIQTKQATLPVSQTQNNTHFLCLPNKHVPFQLKTANTFSQTYTRSNSRPFSTLCPTSVNQSAGTTWANRAPVEKEEGEEGSGIFSTWPWRHIFATNQALFLWEYLLKGSLGKMSGITKKGEKQENPSFQSGHIWFGFRQGSDSVSVYHRTAYEVRGTEEEFWNNIKIYSLLS